MKKLVLICLLVAGYNQVIGQSGFNIQGGIGTMITDQDFFTQEGGAHYGWKGTAFGRLGPNDVWFFNPGLAYERYNLNSSGSFNAFNGHPQVHFLKGYVNMGFYLIHTDLFKMRLSLGGNVNYVSGVDDNPEEYQREAFNETAFGANGILGLDFWVLTFDLGYEQALTDFFANMDKNRNRFWTISSGVFF